MGSVSNSEMFLSEKDLTSTTMEISFLVRPPLEFQEDQCCQIAPFQEETVQEQQDQQQQQQEKEEKCKLLMRSPLELNLPASEEFNKGHKNGGHQEEDERNDGFKTPTSLNHKIPALLKCPPAPRKPRSLPISPKRKAFHRKILLDLTKEIESLFPPALLADLGNKIKKVRQGSDFK
ncbi:hypothetical protein PTKIN_Ptkin11bG0026500 [Pterospermum kingtungense]